MKRRGRPPYPDVLTPRQQEVLELVREGLSNDEIGRSLGISADGAKFHVSEILGRLGVSSRSEAAAWQPEPSPAPMAALRKGFPRWPVAARRRTLSSGRAHSRCRVRGRIAA